MRWLFLALIAVHGLIHFIGVAKGFGWAEVPQLTQPISKDGGVVWLAAALAVLAAAVLFLGAPRVWWVAGVGAVLLSQLAISTSWADARFGTIANVLILMGVVYGFASEGPLGFRATYRREVEGRLAAPVVEPTMTETDLALLPGPVQRYLRVAGVVGQPRVHHFRARWRGRIRAGPADPWMPFTAEQYNFMDEPSRFFLMDARKAGLPVDVFHQFREHSARMRVRLLSLIPIVDARGPEMDRAETVTLFNDLCLLAPSALIDPSIHWDSIDGHTVRAHYTIGANTISAVLRFNEGGELADFVSDDRMAMSSEGKQFTRQRWSTPITGYQSFGPRTVMSHGEGHWHAPEGEFSYIDLELVDLEINGSSVGP